MKNKIVISLFIIIIGLLSWYTESYASLDSIRVEAEGNYKPVITQTEESDDTTYTPPSDTTDEGVETYEVEIILPTKLNVNVYEDYERLENVSDGSIAGTQQITNNNIQDSDELGVSGVEIILSDGTTYTTDSSGKWTTEEAGYYNLRLKYGSELSANGLKYNGQDYTISVSGSGFSSTTINYLTYIQEMNKSYTEVYIVLDFSASMRTTEVGDTGLKRIDVVREAAVSFVQELFDQAQGNLAIGVVAFAHEAVYLKKPTDLEDDIIDAIENFDVQNGVGLYDGKSVVNFTSLNNEVGTDIGNALLTAANGYQSDESNHIIILFSDGCATAHDGVESIYADDSDSELLAKLYKVADLTQTDIETVVNQGITLISIFNQTEGDEKACVDAAFKVDEESDQYLGAYYKEINADSADYQEAIEEVLLNDSMQIIIDSKSEYISTSSSVSYNPDEDSARRTDVDNYYEEIYYDKLEIFNELINKFTNDTTTNETLLMDYILNGETLGKRTAMITNFIDANWMQTVSGDVGYIYEFNYDSEGRVTSISNGTSIVHTFDWYTIYTYTYTVTKTDENGDAVVDENGNEVTTTETDSGRTVPSGATITSSVDYCDVDGVQHEASKVYVDKTEINITAALIKRPTFELETEIYVSGVRLTLSDGTILYGDGTDKYITEDLDLTDVLSEIKKAYCEYLAGNSTMNNAEVDIDDIASYIWLTVDANLLQGATLEMEYTIVIANMSGNDTYSTQLALIDYFDYGVIYSSDSKLLTENATNGDYGWTIVTKEDLQNEDGKIATLLTGNYLSDYTDSVISDEGTLLYVNFTQAQYKALEGISDDETVQDDYTADTKLVNPLIGNNGKRYVKLVVSKILSSELDSLEYKNQVEIASYSNSYARRMNYISDETIESLEVGEVVTRTYVTAGNSIPVASGIEITELVDTLNSEVDTAISTTVHVIPPTGYTEYTEKKRIR